MIPIFMRSVMPHLTRGVIRSARVSSRRAPVRSVSSCIAPSDCYSSSETTWDGMKRLLLTPVLCIAVGCALVVADIRDRKRDALIRETHDLAREARDAREAGELKVR